MDVNQNELEGKPHPAIEALGNCIYAGDGFGAAKAAGVLDYLGFPDTALYDGLALQVAGDFRAAIKTLMKVDEKSESRQMAIKSIITMCSITGDYSNLDWALVIAEDISPISELELRLNCAEHSFKEECEHDYPKKIISTPIQVIGKNKSEVEAYYNVCRMLGDMLACAYAYIRQGIEYQERASKDDPPFDEAPEAQRCLQSYKKALVILDSSRLIGFIKFRGDVGSLAECALSNYKWLEKIHIAKESNACAKASRIIANLCAPETHAAVNPISDSVLAIVNRFLIMRSPMICLVVDKYFEQLAHDAKMGDSKSIDCLNIAYVRAGLGDPCPEGFLDKVKRLFEGSPNIFNGTAIEDIEIFSAMTKKGRLALSNAERLFSLSQDDGVVDASHIALAFFRVLEFEYNGRLIKPLMDKLDFDKIRHITGYHFLRREKRSVIDRDFESWKREIDEISLIKSHVRETMTLGSIRELLRKIRFSNTHLDACAQELNRVIKLVLTPEGLTAFQLEYLEDALSQTDLSAYRNPGAHTGFLSFSKACEAREIVRYWLKEMGTWFMA